MKGKWTVVLRTQGKGLELELNNALNSLIAQTYENLLVLLMIHSNNEKIIEKTLSFIKPFQKMLNIKPIVLRDKQGNRSYPLNAALKNLDCEYLSFLDDDDIYYPNMGSTLIKALEDNDKTFALGRSIDVIERLETNIAGEEYLYTVSKAKRPYQEFSKPLLLLENFIPFNTFILKTSLLDGVKFNEDMTYLEDWDFLKQLILKEEFSFIQLDVPISEYRRRNDITDTFNEDNYEKWLKSRETTDNRLKDKETVIRIGDLKHIKSFYENEFEKQRAGIEIIRNNPGYRIWDKAINNRILKNTVVKLVRKVRGLLHK
ncbi:TPA: glycosyltransferase family 2 protein [Candidatus Dojkabacteria bacterium]|uniref:Glycosyltransferase family 2 protein n=1 Tax=Candidatus Dojkabacteria bacterium TaxID=2099670 RepID=A0A832R9S1_9BACT|nr:glycosyltransferase family 2 protein [Candidatus Dojkabacteria bacterium]